METSRTKGARPRNRHIGVIVLALLAAGCHKREKPGAATTTSASEPSEKSALGADEKRSSATLAEGPPPLLDPVLKVLPIDGVRGPASAIHDEAGDVYLVSSVDGSPLAADGKGFISKMAPDGKTMIVRWIEGGTNKVELNAPKGMAIKGDELYVADIDTVRIFHRRTGLPISEVKIPGTKYLDDVVLGQDGRVYVSDTGLRAKDKGNGLEHSGVEAIYAIYRDPYVTNVNLVARDSLGGPTALFASPPNKIWTVSSRTGEIYWVDPQGHRNDVEKLPEGELEGVVSIGNELLVASRAASAIFRGSPKRTWRIAIGDVKSPADIGYDRKRKRVLVPLFTEDEVRIYDLR